MEEEHLLLLQLKHNRLKTLMLIYGIVWLSGIVLLLFQSALATLAGIIVAAASIWRARSTYTEMKKVEAELESKLKAS